MNSPLRFMPLLLVLLTACGEELDKPSTGGGNKPTNSGFDLTGQLYFDSCFSDGFAFRDMESGLETFVLSDDGMRRISIAPSQTKIAAQDTNKLIYILDSENAANSFSLTNTQNFSGTLLFSEDTRNYLLKEDNSVGEDYLRVRNQLGIIASLVDDDFPGNTFESYDWVDNDSFIFSSSNVMYRVDGLNSPIVTELMREEGIVYGHIAVSRDGTKIAYTKAAGSSPWNEEGDVYVSNIDGTSERAITKDSSLRNVEWSPDGRYIAVAAGSYHGGYDAGAGFYPEIFVIDTNTQTATQVNYSQSYDTSVVERLSSTIVSERKTTCTDGNELFWTN